MLPTDASLLITIVGIESLDSCAKRVKSVMTLTITKGMFNWDKMLEFVRAIDCPMGREAEKDVLRKGEVGVGKSVVEGGKLFALHHQPLAKAVLQHKTGREEG